MHWSDMNTYEKFIGCLMVGTAILCLIVLLWLGVTAIYDRYNDKKKAAADKLVPVHEITGQIIRTISEIEDDFMNKVTKKIVLKAGEYEAKYDIANGILKQLEGVKVATFSVKNNRVIRVSFEDGGK